VNITICGKERNSMKYDELVESVTKTIQEVKKSLIAVYRNNGEWEMSVLEGKKHPKQPSLKVTPSMDELKEMFNDRYVIKISATEYSGTAKDYLEVHENILHGRMYQEYSLDYYSTLKAENKVSALIELLDSERGRFSKELLDHLKNSDKPYAALFELCTVNIEPRNEDEYYKKGYNVTESNEAIKNIEDNFKALEQDKRFELIKSGEAGFDYNFIVENSSGEIESTIDFLKVRFDGVVDMGNYDKADSTTDRCYFILEAGNLDIELCLFVKNDSSEEYLGYYCCEKVNGTWESYDEIYEKVNLDVPDIEKEMFRVLEKYAEENGLTFGERSEPDIFSASERLYNKVSSEYDAYIADLHDKSKEEIIEAAFEITWKKEIVNVLTKIDDEDEFTEKMCGALLAYDENPLDAIYQDFRNADDYYLDDIKDGIKNIAIEVMENNPEKFKKPEKTKSIMANLAAATKKKENPNESKEKPTKTAIREKHESLDRKEKKVNELL